MRQKLSKKSDLYFSFYTLFVYVELIILLVLDLNLFLTLIALVWVLYLQAPFIWKKMNQRFGPVPKVSYLGKHADTGNLWFVAYKLQELYETFPFIENVLKTIPGLYSAWLRLWGANIGEKVNWTSGSKIVDRTHVSIGDRVLIGNHSYISAHIIKKKDNKYILYVKEVSIESDSIVSYDVTLAPGTEIKSRAFLEAGAAIYPNQKVNEGENYERFEELLNKRYDFLFKRERSR